MTGRVEKDLSEPAAKQLRQRVDGLLGRSEIGQEEQRRRDEGSFAARVASSIREYLTDSDPSPAVGLAPALASLHQERQFFDLIGRLCGAMFLSLEVKCRLPGESANGYLPSYDDHQHKVLLGLQKAGAGGYYCYNRFALVPGAADLGMLGYSGLDVLLTTNSAHPSFLGTGDRRFVIGPNHHSLKSLVDRFRQEAAAEGAKPSGSGALSTLFDDDETGAGAIRLLLVANIGPRPEIVVLDRTAADRIRAMLKVFLWRALPGFQDVRAFRDLSSDEISAYLLDWASALAEAARHIPAK